MLSKQTEQYIDGLLTTQTTYRPNPTVLNQVKRVTLVCFVGAASMGKTTIMDALVALEPSRFGKTKSFTTRPPRADDDTRRYYYFDHTEEGLAPVFKQIQDRELLQYNIDPFSRYIYGSEITGYNHPYNLADIWSTSIEGFRQLGFGKLYICSVITEPDKWLARFNERFAPDNPLRQARLKEAVASLEWSLAQTNCDHCFIINRTSKAAAADMTHHFIAGDVVKQPEAREIAQRCLEQAKKELADEQRRG